MDIIEKLKKERKIRSVFDVILKEKGAKDTTEQKPTDIEVRELGAVPPTVVEGERVDSKGQPEKPIREFRTEGMHEFDIESLGSSADGAVRIECKSQVGKLIDAGKFDEAIELLRNLKTKLAPKE
jgi:hypothetical protein